MTEKKEKRKASRCKWFLEFIDLVFPEDEGEKKDD